MFKFTKESAEYNLMVTWWLWLQNHYEVEDGDEYWDEAIKSASVLASKYKGTEVERFATDLVMIGLNRLEELCKR